MLWLKLMIPSIEMLSEWLTATFGFLTTAAVIGFKRFREREEPRIALLQSHSSEWHRLPDTHCVCRMWLKAQLEHPSPISLFLSECCLFLGCQGAIVKDTICAIQILLERKPFFFFNEISFRRLKFNEVIIYWSGKILNLRKHFLTQVYLSLKLEICQ